MAFAVDLRRSVEEGAIVDGIFLRKYGVREFSRVGGA